MRKKAKFLGIWLLNGQGEQKIMEEKKGETLMRAGSCSAREKKKLLLATLSINDYEFRHCNKERKPSEGQSFWFWV
ncbi:hypothetical protein ES319_A05G381000v1 [Gossypium barbadense]|uniref:Uncharacterized protein n=3 Tax=Gossypium TaxID=3633 RepID=A0A5J5W083_GOSBA|nr:hypothetical protein ES319_A05G381000v1 [Gossypium barbadense]TYH20114.1 hypothetical protein ES288_A05G405200v1 [Gossypium darwinii]TYI30722.1 hypothetical protein ES332_A05G407300v1 [Gossypium tomentosum]